MKNLIFLITLISNLPVMSQNPVTINSAIEAKVPYDDLRYSVCYDKFGEGFSRIEGLKLQYFSQDFEKVWERNFELVSGIGKYNWFVTGNNGEEMVLAQYGTAYKVDNIDARLIKVNTSGEVKIIDLGALFNFRGIGGFDFFEDNFVMHAIEAKGAVTPYGNTLKFYTHLLHFNYQLELQGEIITLPAFSADEKHNYIWIYNGLKNGNYSYVSTYYLNGGKPSEKDNDQGKEKRNIEIDDAGKIVFDETSKHADELSAKATATIVAPIKYNRDRFSVILDNQELETLRFFPMSKSFEKVIISKDGNQSENLVTEFYKLTNPKLLESKNTKPSLQIYDVLEDKLNDNLVLIGVNTLAYMYYVIILNNDLSIATVTTYKSYEAGTPQKYAEREFFFYCGSKESTLGTLPDNYKDNPFTAMEEYEKDAMHTILNYDTYQLLITDCFKAQTTEVRKFPY